jgi:hypothetical protein
MDQCTENYECLVINNNAKSNKLTDQVFWYKAEPREDFKIGGDAYWKYSEENYSSEERIDDGNKIQRKNPVSVTKLY